MDYVQHYVDFLKKHISLKKPLKVVCDPSNGTAGMILKKLVGVPNLTITLINDKPDGDFPAHGPNPLIPGATNDISKKVVEIGADIGIIFDADADRAFFIDEKGETLPSHAVAALMFTTHTGPFVADELVYNSLKHMDLAEKIDIHPSRIGQYFIKHLMKERGAMIGAEYSGHYTFKEMYNSDSGIFAMILVLNSLSSMNETFSEFFHSLPKQRLAVDDIKLGDKKWPDIQKIIEEKYTRDGVSIGRRDGLTLDFGDRWISVRPSNTEPLLRLIVGSKSDALSAALLHEIKSLV